MKSGALIPVLAIILSSLALPSVIGKVYEERTAQGEHWGVTYTTSWAGDSAEASEGLWTQNWIRGMAVTDDGTVFSNANWDEHNRNGGVYKDGKVLAKHHRSGAAGIALDDHYVYLNNTREIDGRAHNVIERYHQANYEPAPFSEKESHVIVVGPKQESLWGVAHHDGRLFASDIHANRIRVYDADSGAHIRDFGDFIDTPERTTHPLELATESDGDLWVIQANLDHDLKTKRGLSITGAKLKYNAHGPGCHFVYTQVAGDVTLTAKLRQMHHVTGGSPIAGVMLRGGLDSDAPWAASTLKFAKSSGFASGGWLDGPGGDIAHPPAWFRIKREGNRVIGYESGDGENWKKVGEKQLDLDRRFYIGLAAQSRKGDKPGIADFTQIRLNKEAPDLGDWEAKTIKTKNVVRSGSFKEGVKLRDTKVHRTIRQFSPSGKPTGKSIASVPKCSDIAIHPDGRLLVADDGPDQQIKLFDVSGTPKLVETLGRKRGVFSGVPGAWGDFKLNGPNGVGADADGNIYVAAGGMSDPWDRIRWGMWSNWHTDLRAFSKPQDQGGRLLWKVLGLMFVDSAVLDPQNKNELYTMETHMTMEWSPDATDLQYQPGHEWGETYDQTHDGFRFPDDPRHNVGGTAPVAIRQVGGERFLYLTKMSTKWLAVLRLNAEGKIAKPAAFITSNDMKWPEEQPKTAAQWIWTDADGDGSFQSNEFANGGFRPYRSNSGGWHVDADGTIWHVGNEGLEHLPAQGLNDAKAPVYEPSNMVRQDQPQPFGLGARTKYLAKQDTMYLSGYRPEESWQWKSAGTVLARYDDWSEGNRKPRWTIDILIDEDSWGHPADFSLAGDRLFVVYSDAPNRGAIRIFDTKSGRELGLMTPGPEVGGISGLVDMPHSIHAYQRDNGEYVVLVEEDALGRILIYRNIQVSSRASR